MKSRAGKRFGENLRELRLSRKLTQEELAAEIGIASNSLSKLERGINSPSGRNIDRIADFFGVDLGVLFLDRSSFGSNQKAIQMTASEELREAYMSFCRKYGIEIRIESDESKN